MDIQVRGKKVLPDGGTKQLVIQLIEDSGELSINDLCELTGVSFSCMARHVDHLLKAGKLRISRYQWQTSLGSPRKLFSLPERGNDEPRKPPPPVKVQVLQLIEAGVRFKHEIAQEIGVSKASVSHALAVLHAEGRISWVSRMVGWVPSGQESRLALPMEWQQVLDCVKSGLRTRAEIIQATGLDDRSCSHILTMLRAVGQVQFIRKRWQLSDSRLSLMMGVLPSDFIPDFGRCRVIRKLAE